MGELIEPLLIFIVVIAYPFSIFFDTSVYNLKYLLNRHSEVRYWMSTIQVFQYSARIFMVIFIPGISLLTELNSNFNQIYIITILIHIITAVILLLSFFSFKKINKINIFLISIINFFTGKKNVSEGFIDREGVLSFSLSFLKRKLFFASYISHLLVATSMTYIYIFSFYFNDRILTLNSITQIINMVAISILLVAVDPRIMSSFDKENGGVEEIKVIYASRILAHISIAIVFYFTGLYLN